MDDVRERFQNLHEIVAAARAKLNRNIWDYLIGGAETETTIRRNRLALDSLALRPRILRIGQHEAMRADHTRSCPLPWCS